MKKSLYNFASLVVLAACFMAGHAAASGVVNPAFVQKGASSVARSFADKLGDVVNVKDKGAKCNGVANDTAAIQAAVSAGGTVQLPTGVCMVSKIVLPSNVVLVGQGNLSEIKRIAGASAGAIIQASGVSQVTVSNLTINGNSAATTGADSNLFITGSSDVLIDNVRSIDSLLHGFSLQSGADRTAKTVSTIRNSTVKGAKQYGVEAQDMPRVVIENNRILKVDSYGILVYGTAANATQNATINGNTVSEAAGNGIGVPFVNGGTALTPGVEELTMIGNTVEQSGLNGYVIQARFATVTGNTASRNGVTMDHQGFVINVMGVTMTGNTASRNAGVGIDFGDCKRVIATGNLVEENGIIGIEINSTEDFVVSGNVVIGNNKIGGAGALGAGILAHLGTGGYTFAGNTMNGVISSNVVRSGTNQQFGIKATGDTENIRIADNDAIASGTVRDIEILTPSGKFTQSGNTVTPPTLTAAASTTIPQVGKFFTVNPGATINSIVTDGGTYEVGREIMLRFTGAVTVANGAGNVFLAGSALSAVNGSILVLVRSDANGWAEVSRRL